MKTITVNFSKWRSISILFLSLLYLIIVVSWVFFVGWVVLFLVLPLAFFLSKNALKSWQELTGKRAALIFDKDGIVDNSHWYSLGRVEWEAVDVIKTKHFFWVKTIQILFKEPRAVIQKEKNFLKKFVQTIQLLLQKTPMLLNTKTLAISHNELATLLQNIDFENPDFVDMSEHLID